jgi:hypothetical protein
LKGQIVQNVEAGKILSWAIVFWCREYWGSEKRELKEEGEWRRRDYDEIGEG